MADVITMLGPTTLKVHPRNEEFFDDVNGEDFDRLVESIKEHGVLTPLRATKDLILISGHQRRRAAIEANIAEVPVIIDNSTDDDEVLMKLIETNFGRMKNDPIKQARWIKEYEELRGVRQGSAWQKAERQIVAQVSQEDIAKELGVDKKTIQRLKKLLELDPAIQQLISDGVIAASTGYDLISKLSLEDQQKLIDKLPDNVKFSANTIKAKIDEIRAEGAENANRVQERNDELQGRIDKLVRENNELLAGNFPATEAHKREVEELQEKYRKAYEKLQQKERRVEDLQAQLTKAVEAKTSAEAKLRGGDEAVMEFQSEIDRLTEEKKVVEKERNDLEYQLAEKEDEINNLKQENKDGFMRVAIAGPSGERALDNYRNKVVQTVSFFENSVNDILKDVHLTSALGQSTIDALCVVASKAIASAEMLHNALLSATSETDSNLSA